ncbi:hypothetical protein ABZ938_32525, partial [Streptomyces sp. NPDC046409]
APPRPPHRRKVNPMKRHGLRIDPISATERERSPVDLLAAYEVCWHEVEQYGDVGMNAHDEAP